MLFGSEVEPGTYHMVWIVNFATISVHGNHRKRQRKTAALLVVGIQEQLAKFNKSGIQKTVSGRYLGVAHATLGEVLTMRSDLMGHIWGGRLELCADPCNTPLGRILSSLLASPITRFWLAHIPAHRRPKGASPRPENCQLVTFEVK